MQSIHILLIIMIDYITNVQAKIPTTDKDWIS